MTRTRFPQWPAAAALVACAAFTAPAAAQSADELLRSPQPYAAGRLALASPLVDEGGDDSPWAFGRGHGAGLAGGALFGDFAAEVELTLATLNAADRRGGAEGGMAGQEHLASLLVAGRWQPPITALFYGVAGAGVGLTHVEWDRVRRGDAPLHADDEAPSYVLDVGLGARFWGALAFDLTLRHVGLGGFDYVEADGTAARMPATRHDLLRFGLRYDL